MLMPKDCGLSSDKELGAESREVESLSECGVLSGEWHRERGVRPGQRLCQSPVGGGGNGTVSGNLQ